MSCRFYVSSHNAPSLLFFHGNGELASDYDSIAPFYNRLGINLFVADYRGYGSSGGRPSFSSMLADAHPIFKHFLAVLKEGGFASRVFVMGRSLGTVSALALASSYQDQIQGLIVESGFASVVRLLWRLGLPIEGSSLKGVEAATLGLVRSIRLPVLIMHGEDDMLIPVEEAVNLYNEVGTEDKRLVIIPGAGHNDIMIVGMKQYFAAITEFVLGEAAKEKEKRPDVS